MDRRVTPPKRVTSPAWGPPPPCKQALKQFLNYSAAENLCCIFYPALLISNSSILLYLFDTQIMNCLARHKNLSLFLKESSKCHNINYRVKIML